MKVDASWLASSMLSGESKFSGWRTPLFPPERGHDDVEYVGVRKVAVDPLRARPGSEEGNLLRGVLIFERKRNLLVVRGLQVFGQLLALEAKIEPMVCREQQHRIG